jgi:DNA damage-binding protein 1
VDISNDGSVPTYTLKKLAEWNHNYLVTSLVSFGDHVVAGDHISSVSLLKIIKDEVVLEARDYGPLYPVAVEALDSKSLICANVRLSLPLQFIGCHLSNRTPLTFLFTH